MSSSSRRSGMTMKSFLSFLLVSFVILSFLPSSKAWDQGDFEIFDLVDELEKSEGADVNFYSWLNIPSTASSSDIGRAYRKLSLQLHPDKNKNDRAAKERFARLGKVAAILRSPSAREKYNFFYKNGVPRWRGTGYYYARFRPGLGTVVTFVALIAGGMQHLAQWINFHQERRRITQFVADARAYMIHNAPKNQGPPTVGKSLVQIGGQQLRCEVKSDTYIVITPPKGEPIHLNVDRLDPPKVSDVFLLSLPKCIFQKVFGPKRVKQDKESDGEGDEAEDESDKVASSQNNGKSKSTKVKTTMKKGEVSKVGGSRRTGRKNQK